MTHHPHVTDLGSRFAAPVSRVEPGQQLALAGVISGARRAASSEAPRPRTPRGSGTDTGTFTRALRTVEHNLAEWNRLVAAYPLEPSERAARDVQALGQSLRALYTTYASTRNLRLRRALLDEAGRVSRQMHAVAVRLRWRASKVRPVSL
jgi:hypothetical protein